MSSVYVLSYVSKGSILCLVRMNEASVVLCLGDSAVVLGVALVKRVVVFVLA